MDTRFEESQTSGKKHLIIPFLDIVHFKDYSMENILEVRNLKKYFKKKNIFGTTSGILKAVDDVSFAIKRSEILVIAGESGSGKSTIAKLILRALSNDDGKIIFEDSIIGNSKEDLKKIRTNCQMVQQDPYDSINPRMRIGDIILEPLEIYGIGTKEEQKNRLVEVLKEVKLEPVEEIINKFPHMLSGGQRQRVVLARALAIKPKIIIADEPVSMLDVSIRAEILELMKDLQKRHQITFIYITHDLATARFFGQKIAILYLGKIVEIGDIDDVLLNPKHPYTQALIDAISEPDPENLHREKIIRIRESDGTDVYQGCRFRARCPYIIEKCSTEPELIEKKNRGVACHVDIN